MLRALGATVIDVSTNCTVIGPSSITVEFLNVSSNGTITSLHNVTTTSGVATWPVVYPSNGKAYAFMARVVPAAGSIQQGIVCNPLQLTVSKPATLLLNVSRDWLSGNHTIEGWLLNATSGISGIQVKITVNDTHYLSSVTNASGYFSLSLNLQPVNGNATTYVITASFEDNLTAPINATAWATTLDGQQYPACTTIQYGYEPVFNTTTLTVLPQSTEVLAMTNSPDEMQKEAEQNGTLKIYSEWSWWYPWYRVHFQFAPNGTVEYDYGVSVLPFGNTLAYTEYMNNTAVNFVLNANLAILSAIALSEYQGYIISMLGPAGFLGALIISLTAKLTRARQSEVSATRCWPYLWQAS